MVFGILRHIVRYLSTHVSEKYAATIFRA